LNDFYEAEKDNFTRGLIRFPLNNLSEGEHTIVVKVWDVFNNSSESTINFIVTNPNDISIVDFIAYPNPFILSTDIYFQHNKANQELSYVLDIYSMTGVLVKRIERSSDVTSGYRVGPINWDGIDNYGGRVSAGIYIGNLAVNTEHGDFLSKSIRIILLPQE